MNFLNKNRLVSLAILFLIIKTVTIIWFTLDMIEAMGQLAPHIRIIRCLEIILIIISAVGLLIKNKAGFIISMLYSFVVIEYGIIYDLIITHNSI